MCPSFPKLSRYIWKSFQRQQGIALAESEPLGTKIMHGSILKEKNQVKIKTTCNLSFKLIHKAKDTSVQKD